MGYHFFKSSEKNVFFCNLAHLLFIYFCLNVIFIPEMTMSKLFSTRSPFTNRPQERGDLKHEKIKNVLKS